jgi:hypothetical protein
MTTELETYGQKWPASYQQVDIELKMYLKMYRDEVLDSAILHFKKAAKMLFPDKIYRWSYWSDRAVESYIKEDFMTVWGGGGTGKSTTFAMIYLVDWVADPIGTTIKIYTTDLGKQKLRMFGEIIRMHDAVGNLPGEVVSSQFKLVFKDSEGNERKNAGIYALAVTNRAGRVQKVSTFGVHNDRNRMALDEMQGTPAAAFDSIDNFVQGGTDFKFNGIGNPEDWDDMLCQYSRPKGNFTEWSPAKAEAKDDRWDTFINGERLGVCLWYDGLKSPRITEKDGERKFSFLTGPKGHAMVRKLRGEESPQWWSQVRGFIRPGYNESLTVIDRRTINLLRANMHLPFESTSKTIVGLDPAFTEMGDRAQIVAGRVGRVPGGKLVMQILEGDSQTLSIRSKDPLPVSHQLALQTNHICQKLGVDKHGLGCDTSATQAGPADVLKQDYGFYVERVNFGGAASKRAWDPSEPKKPARDLYGSKVSELYHLAACLIRHGHVKGMYQDLIEEMTSRRSFFQNRRMHVEPKADYIKRMKKSPDQADAFVVLCWLFVKRWRFRIGSGDVIASAPRSLMEKELEMAHDYLLEPDFSDGNFYELS